MPRNKVRKNRGTGRLQSFGKDGTIRNVTTFPYLAKNKDGKQEPVPNMLVDGKKLEE